MPTIPIQTRLAPPTPAGPRPASASASTHAPSAPASPASIRHSSLGISHSAAAPAGAVALQIDTLVLHGFSAAEARRVGAAFEKELTRLLAESPLSESSLNPALPHARPPSPSASSAIGHWSLYIGHSGALGAGAARALHARLRA